MKQKLLAILLALACLAGCGRQLPTPMPQQPDGQEQEQQEQPEAQPEQTQPPAQPTNAEKARALVAQMTDEQKVGQMFLAHWPEEDAAQFAAQYHLGGYILFADFFAEKTPEQARQTLADCQNEQEIPMALAVDEEGGTVNRVSRYPQYRAEPFVSPQQLYAQGGLDRLAQDAAEKAALLASLGLNLNLAPVCDLSQNPQDFIYYRTLGCPAEETAEYIATVVQAARGRGVGCCLKHVPGYGGTADTH